MLTGAFQPQVRIEKIAAVHRPADIGRYFASGICAHCHRLDRPNPVEGEPTPAPALAAMAAAYPPDAFRRLLKTGVGMSKADLGLMSDIGRHDTHVFTDAEIAAIQVYLKGEAEKLPPQ